MLLPGVGSLVPLGATTRAALTNDAPVAGAEPVTVIVMLAPAERFTVASMLLPLPLAVPQLAPPAPLPHTQATVVSDNGTLSST